MKLQCFMCCYIIASQKFKLCLEGTFRIHVGFSRACICLLKKDLMPAISRIRSTTDIQAFKLLNTLHHDGLVYFDILLILQLHNFQRGLLTEQQKHLSQV